MTDKPRRRLCDYTTIELADEIGRREEHCIIAFGNELPDGKLEFAVGTNGAPNMLAALLEETVRLISRLTDQEISRN